MEFKAGCERDAGYGRRDKIHGLSECSRRCGGGRQDGAIRERWRQDVLQQHVRDVACEPLPLPDGRTIASRNWLDAVLGIRSGVAPGFWFDVFAGYKITSDDVLFTQSDVWSANYFGSFSVAEPGIDTKQLFVGANLKYSYQQWFDIALKGVYNNWKAETDEGELPHAWGEAGNGTECEPDRPPD